MFALELRCGADEAERLSAELWEWTPLALGERSEGESAILTAGFAGDEGRDAMLQAFAAWSPEWRRDETDWTAATEAAWPPREIGERILIAAPWHGGVHVAGRNTVIINPGMASGTGEHPCTQLVAEALERHVQSDSRVADIGSGSGILALIAARLGAGAVLAIEPDLDAVAAAEENIASNETKPMLAAGFADAIATGWATITVANISGSVLLAIFDELMRITAPDGTLIVSGFEESEAARMGQALPDAKLTVRDGWACLEATPAAASSLPSS